MTTRTLVGPANSAALWILAVIAILFFLRFAKALLIPIALGILISYALEPLVAWLERHRVPRLGGAAFVLAGILALCAAGAFTLRDDATELVESIPKAIERVQAMVRSQLGPGAAAIQGTTESGSLVERAVNTIVTAAGQTAVVFFLTYFLLVSGPHVRRRFVEVAGRDPEGRRTVSTIIDDVNGQIQRYLLVLLVTGVIVSAATWAVLAWMGVPHAPMWGIFAGIFNSIPYFGPVIVSGGLFVVGMVQGGGTTAALQMSGAAIAITSLEGWVLTPALMGKAERMSALTVFLGLLLWTWVWGEWGTLLAVPMLVVVKSVADHVDVAKPVGRLMAP